MVDGVVVVVVVGLDTHTALDVVEGGLVEVELTWWLVVVGGGWSEAPELESESAKSSSPE